ncbi:DUF6415 family natural product biosynthesis protein [Streptomyces sp. E11-3]|uniref:DUF6415 family natural product biosynthesis protein n=1 Tax=Streptomyces sp. E11-3 TaxID=3110112 RepID=UPI003980C302
MDEQDDRPPDIETMRAVTASLLADDAQLPRYEDLELMLLQLRGHLMLLIPIVEDIACVLSARDVPAQCALPGVSAARDRLNDVPAAVEKVGLVSEVRRAQRLARSVDALCDHYENLNGIRT